MEFLEAREGEAAKLVEMDPEPSQARRSTTASPAARRSATRSCRWRCSSRSSRSSTRPTPGLDIDALRIVADGVNALRSPERAMIVITPLPAPARLHRARLRARPRSARAASSSPAARSSRSSSTGPTLTNACTTISLGAGASLHHQRVQTEAPGATHIGHTQVSQAAGSRYETSSIMHGSDIARHAIDVTLHEPDAHVALTGLYRPAGHQRHDTAVCIDHAASHGTSTQEFKGVVDDHARGSFSGRIIVRPDTIANDAQQMNRNLVLPPPLRPTPARGSRSSPTTCAAPTAPRSGELDDNALFYLRSRGIPEPHARQLLIEGFAGEVLEAVDVAWLRQHLREGLEQRRPAIEAPR
jgi:Fe-S cluster assembly protein SufD